MGQKIYFFPLQHAGKAWASGRTEKPTLQPSAALATNWPRRWGRDTLQYG